MTEIADLTPASSVEVAADLGARELSAVVADSFAVRGEVRAADTCHVASLTRNNKREREPTLASVNAQQKKHDYKDALRDHNSIVYL